MYRPQQSIASALKPRLNYAKTWANIAQLLKNPAPIRPASPPEHLAEFLEEKKVKTPRLKGNVLHTLKEVMHIFLAEERRATRPINVAIRTTRTSLAKRCGNLDPKTAYRHILTLIEHGFLRGKQHVRAGLQLLINPVLLVFDASTSPVAIAAQKPPVAPETPQISPSDALANLRALALQFSQGSSSRP